MWDERYASEDYRFGTRPNRFLVDCVAGLTPAKALALGEGEGRNAVFLAGLGFDVTAVDQSAVGLAKARRLAQMNGVRLHTITADLNDFVIQPAAWSLIINFFCHLPSAQRAPLHQRVTAGLVPGGAYVYEVFSPAQLQLATGGPSDRDLLVSLEEARRDLAALDLRVGRELVRYCEEDDPSTLRMAVLQVLAVKPA
jgi:SAM-dependent methyltransferase